jgi:hypothetical protein
VPGCLGEHATDVAQQHVGAGQHGLDPGPIVQHVLQAAVGRGELHAEHLDAGVLVGQHLPVAGLAVTDRPHDAGVRRKTQSRRVARQQVADHVADDLGEGEAGFE